MNREEEIKTVLHMITNILAKYDLQITVGNPNKDTYLKVVDCLNGKDYVIKKGKE